MKKEKQVRAKGKAASPQPQPETVPATTPPAIPPGVPQTAENLDKSDGHPTAENDWYKIGLSPVEVSMLKNIQAKVWIDPEDSTRAKTLRLLIVAGLAHYKALATVLFGDAEYCRQEGFDSYSDFCERKIQAQLPESRAGIQATISAVTARVRGSGQAARREMKQVISPACPSAVSPTPLPEGWQVHGLMDLEYEVSAAIGIMDLLSQRLADFMDACGSENMKNAGLGVMELADRAQTSLRAKFDAAWEYYRALPGAGAGSAEAGKGGAK